jgi:D-alanyl-lipoteichoic acid acyltransferase DltB (MBOAT superfamily)
MRNFNFPYFSRDIAEFWRRWHISLTTWFRDYIYIPLGGSRVSRAKVIRNTFIIFLVSGFWHGANWTFIVWGAYHALLFLPLILLGQNRKYTNTVAEGKALPSAKEFFQMGMTFALVVLGWILFRSGDISDAWNYIVKMFSFSSFTILDFVNTSKLITFCFILLVIEWIGRDNSYAIEKLLLTQKRYTRWGFYCVILYLIIVFGVRSQEFIYFQF